jgi:hypothetical protein
MAFAGDYRHAQNHEEHRPRNHQGGL